MGLINYPQTYNYDVLVECIHKNQLKMIFYEIYHDLCEVSETIT